MDCAKCVHEHPCVGHTDEHDYFGDCKHFKNKSDYDILEKAFQLLVYDVDMSSVDEDVFQKVFDEMCDNKCEECKDCKECIREYYINKAKEGQTTER